MAPAETGLTESHEELAAARPEDPAHLLLAQARVAGALFGPTVASDFGRFRVLERVGSGGMGVIYAAYDPELDRRVALKLVSVPGRSREIALAEAKSLARLSHPNVVPVHDVGVAGDTVYIVLEFVRGETLDRWVRGRTQRQVIDVYRQAGEGLAAAHEAGLVHRDFKPSNALVGSDGRVRVVDFGLACEAANAGDREQQRPRFVAGTPRYMAPEQAAGAAVTAMADQYSLAVALSEALTAGGGSIPRWLELSIRRASTSDPLARFPSMREFLRAVGRDPVRIWRGRAVMALLVTIAAMAFIAARSAVASRDDACNNSRERFSAVWHTDMRRGALARLATFGEYGSSLAGWADQNLHEYADRWGEGYRDACLSGHHQIQSGALVDRRMACLERGRSAFATVAAIIESAETRTLPEVARAVRALPSIDACADLQALLADVEPPPPAVAAPVAELRGEVERARIQVAAGRFEEARAIAEHASSEARAIGYPPLLADALLVQGHAVMSMDERPMAVPLLAEATRVAFEVGADAIAVEAWARRAWAEGTSGDYVGALGGREVVEALAARAPSGRFARALLYNNAGCVELAREHRDKARLDFERALTEARNVIGPGAVELVNVRLNLGLTEDDLARRDQLFAEAAGELTRLLGGDHPLTLNARWVRGATTTSLGRAAALLIPTCEGLDRHHALATQTARCWSEVGYIDNELGDHDGAVSALERAVATKADLDAAWPEALPYLALWRGDARAAVEAFQAALTKRTAQSPGDPWWERLDRSTLELGLGRALRAAGRLRDARAHLRSSVTALVPIARDHPTADIERRLGRARAELAAVLAATGGPRSEVAEVAAAAASWLRQAGGSLVDMDALAASGHGG